MSPWFRRRRRDAPAGEPGGVDAAGHPDEVYSGTRRRITVVGEPVLADPCRAVPESAYGTEELHGLVDDLFRSMACADGVGLAANQIGVDLAVFVFDCHDDTGVRHIGHVVNPHLELPEARRAVPDTGAEGCLSVPGPVADVSRAHRAVVSGVDRDGRRVRYEATGFLARCFQHEVDHLGGRLYLDHLTSRARARVLEEMTQMQDEVWARWDRRAREIDDLSRRRPR